MTPATSACNAHSSRSASTHLLSMWTPRTTTSPIFRRSPPLFVLHSHERLDSLTIVYARLVRRSSHSGSRGFRLSLAYNAGVRSAAWERISRWGWLTARYDIGDSSRDGRRSGPGNDHHSKPLEAGPPCRYRGPG